MFLASAVVGSFTASYHVLHAAAVDFFQHLANHLHQESVGWSLRLLSLRSLRSTVGLWEGLAWF